MLARALTVIAALDVRLFSRDGSRKAFSDVAQRSSRALYATVVPPLATFYRVFARMVPRA
jgi:hypothetical protein